MRVSAERICLILKSKGIEHANIKGYKLLVNSLKPEQHNEISEHLSFIAQDNDAHESLLYMRQVDALAKRLEKDENSHARNTPVYERRVTEVGSVHSAKQQRTEQEQQLQRRKHYVYGNSCAFMFELDWLKKRVEHSHQLKTVTVEAARIRAPRNFDWANRISFQLTQLELPQFTAVMLGALTDGRVWEACNHGINHDKHFRCKEQENSIFMKLEQAGQRWPVRVGQEHRYQILSLCTEALHHNDKHLDISTIRQMCFASIPR